MGTAIKHPVPDQVKPSFVIFDIRACWASECPDVKNYYWRLNTVWHRMLLWLYPYGNSGHKRVNHIHHRPTKRVGKLQNASWKKWEHASEYLGTETLMWM